MCDMQNNYELKRRKIFELLGDKILKYALVWCMQIEAKMFCLGTLLLCLVDLKLKVTRLLPVEVARCLTGHLRSTRYSKNVEMKNFKRLEF
jgi:hypothetical protein